MSDEEFLNKLKEAFKEKIIESSIPRKNIINIIVPKEYYKEVIKFIVEVFNIPHIQTITGIDMGNEIQIIAHMGRSITINVKTSIDKNNPEIYTITDIIQGASLYEREVHDLLGVNFIGHPNLKRVILPENWPKGLYPLRKEYKPEHPKPLRGV